MRIVKNNKGQGNIFKDGFNKVCFFNKFSKYYNLAMKWEEGEISDFYFKVVKSFPKYDIIDIDEDQNIFKNVSLLDEEELKILDWEFKNDKILATIVNYEYKSGLDVIKGKEVAGYYEKGTKEVYFEVSEPVKYDFERVRSYLKSLFKEEYRGFEEHIKYNDMYVINYNLPYASYQLKDNKFIIKVENKENYEKYLELKNNLKYKRVISYTSDEIKEKVKEAYKKFAKRKMDGRWVIDRYVGESDDGFRRGGNIEIQANDDIIFELAFPKEFKIAKEQFDEDEAKLEQFGKEIVVLDLEGAYID